MPHTIYHPNHLGEGIHYNVEEPCPHCGNYIPVKLNKSLPHLEITCPVCGESMMLCNACKYCGNFCNWEEDRGCRMDIAHIPQNEAQWKAYLQYLRIWVDFHADLSFIGCHPIDFYEFLYSEYYTKSESPDAIFQKAVNTPEISDQDWQKIADMMNDDVREKVHAELAPCSNEEFLRCYLKLNPEFAAVLKDFEIEL